MKSVLCFRGASDADCAGLASFFGFCGSDDGADCVGGEAPPDRSADEILRDGKRARPAAQSPTSVSGQPPPGLRVAQLDVLSEDDPVLQKDKTAEVRSVNESTPELDTSVPAFVRRDGYSQGTLLKDAPAPGWDESTSDLSLKLGDLLVGSIDANAEALLLSLASPQLQRLDMAIT